MDLCASLWSVLEQQVAAIEGVVRAVNDQTHITASNGESVSSLLTTTPAGAHTESPSSTSVVTVTLVALCVGLLLSLRSANNSRQTRLSPSKTRHDHHDDSGPPPTDDASST